MPFLFSRRFILTVTVFTVLFTAWYRPKCIFFLLIYVITCLLFITLNAALLCCEAPRTSCWIWRSINKIIIIFIILLSGGDKEFLLFGNYEDFFLESVYLAYGVLELCLRWNLEHRPTSLKLIFFIFVQVV